MILATIVATTELSKSDSVQGWFQESELSAARSDSTPYDHKLSFLSAEDRLFTQVLPNIDLGKPSIILLGSSNARMSLMPSSLTPTQREHVFNFGLSSATHRQQAQLLDYLLEHGNLSSAKEETSVVIFGLFYGNALNEQSRFAGRYFRELFARLNSYTYDPKTGIQPLAITPILTYYSEAKFRAMHFLRRIPYGFGWRNAYAPFSKHAISAYQSKWKNYLGPDWRREMIEQVKVLEEAIKRLRAKNGRAHLVILPLGSWHRVFPYPSAFSRLVHDVSRRRDIPLTDLSALLADWLTTIIIPQ